LVAANAAWQLNWSKDRLAQLAAELGSDVPFFLTRGAAVCRGRGEQIENINATRLHAVIVRPPIGLATPKVYKECRPTDSPRSATSLIADLGRGRAHHVGRQLFNDLQSAAARLTPWIATLQNEFENQNVLGHQMSGSGSSYFGLCRSHRQARRIAARLRARDIGAVFEATTAVTH
jgi:4-diphosphocytidyl-2-C-methyl-D-erythritol kinase